MLYTPFRLFVCVSVSYMSTLLSPNSIGVEFMTGSRLLMSY